MGRIIAWLMIITGSVILGFNGYKFWGELKLAVKDPKVAMKIADDWQETEIEPSLTSVENFNVGEDQQTSNQEFGTEENVGETNGNLDGSLDEGNEQQGKVQKTASTTNTSVETVNGKTSTSPPTQNSDSTLQVGSQIGQLIIPKISAYLPIVEGTDDNSLKKGVGKYRGYGTVAPDQTGHVVLSGHRDTVFRKLGQLKNGDKIYIKYKNRIYTYQIRKTWITHAEDRTVIVPIPRPVLTVTTCYPFDYKGNAPDRYIIRADLIRIHQA
jgi:LPXTG-site transpeptidase (sortase) family protein